jgi:hypothetical protein
MNDVQPSQLSIQVACDGATDEELDRMTRQLLSRLLETEVESASLTRGESIPAGAKGDPVTIGAIMVSALPTALPAVISVLGTFLAGGRGRNVKVKWGDFEYEGSQDGLEKAWNMYRKGKPKS